MGPRSGYKAVWRSLTAYERRLAWEHRILGVLWEIKFGLVSATRAGQLIYLCQVSLPLPLLSTLGRPSSKLGVAS